MSLHREAEDFKQAVGAFHTHHSKMTWNAGTPGIDPWLRDTLVSLQYTLNKLAELEIKIARQMDLNTENINRVFNHINSQK